MPELAFKAFQFPSHAVGLELYKWKRDEDKLIAVSPSHTVGLELSILLNFFTNHFSSPSHTVGLEQKA